MDFLLMNKNQRIFSFSSETNEYGEVLFEQQEEAESKLPPGFTDIQSYIEHRRAPKSRKHVRQLLLKTGTENLEQYLIITKALGLNDTFWVKMEGETTCWEEVSLYRNPFNETIARLAFDGEGISQSSSSPEFQTDGTYAKCWKRFGDEICLLKAGSAENEECLSEFCASQLAEALHLKHVSYDLMLHHDRLVTSCPIFTSEACGYAKAIHFIDSARASKLSYLFPFFCEQGFEKEFRQMIVFDALILNLDRHAGNYGFLVDNDTQEILGMAPLFDHNRSLLFDAGEPFTEAYFQNAVPRIGNDFNITAHKMLTEDLRSDLKNLEGFHFQGHELLSKQQKKRLERLERVVNGQIRNILEGRALFYCKNL